MLKLIGLEMKKFKIRGYFRTALIIYLIIAAFMCLVTWGQTFEGETQSPAQSYSELLPMMDTLARVTFIVFASVLLSRFVIDEFKTKSITVLFMYPINRKKLIFAKLLIVMGFTFINIILSNVFINVVYFVFNSFLHVVPNDLTLSVLLKHSLSVFMNTIAASCMSLIPLYIGMRKYSVPATIITSLLIVSVFGSQINGFSLNSIIIIPVILAAVGLVIAYISIKNVENVDLIK
ncbi:ABC transporter permease [Fictibacillus barbaricus]|uniref:ABC transporter permease n=1 Tax=Fictibacillus barbaricus TaxID=182136 RepID=A0ABS2ZA88_9BACL|nr:ABC transporter permease [Fictibacillus barbaricus]MBN3544157.1 ABC transporter permease [Fictibacillus barbaricus]GGB69388.1 hypothetical protein GCM10007199_39500 [Fictibacillus barbaricus]